jgi:hypothetical protein
MWLALMQVAFVAFVFALYGLAWRGARRDGSLSPAAWRWAMLAALAFALWLLALPRIPRP